MCGRYTAAADLREVVTSLGVEEVIASLDQPQYNIAPTQLISAVRQDGEKRQLDLFSWGLQLDWANTKLTPSNLINARVESVTTKPSFREAAKYRRCLIPATGWYEWQSTIQSAGRKQPYYFSSPTNQVIAFAGIYEVNQKGVKSAAIITKNANEVVAPIHDRMPLILTENQFEDWLDPTANDSDSVVAMALNTIPPDLLGYPVSPEVNSARAQGAQLIQPAAPEPTQPSLFEP